MSLIYAFSGTFCVFLAIIEILITVGVILAIAKPGEDGGAKIITAVFGVLTTGMAVLFGWLAVKFLGMV